MGTDRYREVTIDRDSSPTELHRVWRAEWYPVAAAVVATGHDCVIHDPEADQDDVFYDGEPDHGTIKVVATPGLGWSLYVTQCEGDGTEELG